MSKTLQQWLSHQETIPAKYTGDGLANMRKAATNCHLFDALKNKYIITIGGTNGKGSCVTFLEAILLAAKYKIGAYTSPHLLRYNERIRINGKEVDDNTLCDAFNAIESCSNNVEAPLTYFETGTLAALHIFTQHDLDILILEVGLGGRYDAVNIVDSDIAIITTISLDHIQQLSDNREDIGNEKAGIMRANKPIICGDFAPPQSIYQNAAKIGAQLYCINKDFCYATQSGFWEWEHAKVKFTQLPLPHLPMQNAATALMAIAFMQQRFVIPIQAIQKGLQTACLLGRLQIMQLQNVQIILDVAHNQESAHLLAYNLTQMPCHGRTIAVTSMLKDKEIAATFLELKNIVNTWHIGILDNPRGASQKQLENSANSINLQEIFFYEDVTAAFKAAIATCKPCDRIIVFGSFYAVAEVLKLKFDSSHNG